MTSADKEQSPKGHGFALLTKDQQNLLLKMARLALEKYVETQSISDGVPPTGFAGNPDDRRGVFVTLYRGGKLRGCVGCHESRDPLHITVQKMAVSSGFKDFRFPPLTRKELGEIRIEISAYLTPILPIDSPEEFQIGKHGIIMQLGQCTSTFLPKVAVEQGWNNKSTLEHLCLKAGLNKDNWRDPGTRFFVYETQVFREA